LPGRLGGNLFEKAFPTPGVFVVVELVKEGFVLVGYVIPGIVGPNAILGLFPIPIQFIGMPQRPFHLLGQRPLVLLKIYAAIGEDITVEIIVYRNGKASGGHGLNKCRIGATHGVPQT